MKRIVYLFLALSLFSGLTYGQGNMNYGEYGAYLMNSPFTTFRSELDTLNSTSPPASTKALRSALAVIRNIMDVFVFAYPPDLNGDLKPKEDMWVEVRECIDDGYMYIGDFKDLADSGVNYTKKQAQKLLNLCLEWKDSYVSHAKEYDQYLLGLSKTKLYKRSKNVLSPYFWSQTPYTPSLKLSGVENIALLAKGLFSESIEGLDTWEDLNKITDDKQQVLFHDYRKLIRGTYATATFTSDIYVSQPPCSVSNAEKVVDTLYSMIGKVHDRIVAYDYYHKHGPSEKEDEAQEEAEDMWSSLKRWISTTDPASSMNCLMTSLIPVPTYE